jgi:hypothetical protein
LMFLILIEEGATMFVSLSRHRAKVEEA